MVQNNSKKRAITPEQACRDCFMILCSFVNLESDLRNAGYFGPGILDIALRIEHKLLFFIFHCLTLCKKHT